MADEVDLIVIGSGQGGVPLAAEFGKAGKRVVLFERERLGGTCVNFGCTPSKAFLASAHAAGRARLAGDRLGVHCDVHVDQRAVMQRVRAVRDEWHAGVGPRLERAGGEVVLADAAFTGERTVRGGEREVRANVVVIDTGTSPAIPPIPGLDGVPYLTNKTFFDQETLPARLIVLGGGYVGLELGQGAQRLGSAVTIVEGGARLMAREEADAADVLRTSLERDGVQLELGAHASAIAYDGSTYRVTLASGEVIEGDGLLIATGRTPNTSGLGLERSGIATTQSGTVQVDEHLESTCAGVYAIGEAAGQPAFTHVAWEDYRRLASTLAGTPRRRDDRVLSYSTFTEPQLGRTGRTEAEARAAGIDARTVTLQLSEVARGVEWDLELGFFRLVVDNANGKMIGATFVGYEAGEIVQVVGFAIQLGATGRQLDDFVAIHPTFGEGLPSLARLLEKA